MRKHIQLLGILNTIWGSLYVLGALIIMLIFGGAAGLIATTSRQQDAHIAIPIISLFGGALAVFFLILSIPSIIAGVGLLKMAPWARVLGIVVSALHLFSIPFGTALGIYGLWVLLSSETLPLFTHPQGPIRV